MGNTISGQKEVGVRISMPLQRLVPLKVIPGFTKMVNANAECLPLSSQERENIENIVRKLCIDKGCNLNRDHLVDLEPDRQGHCQSDMKIHYDGNKYYIIVDWVDLSSREANTLLARFYDDADREVIRKAMEQERAENEEGERMYNLERQSHGRPRKTRVFNTATGKVSDKFNEANYNANYYGGRRSRRSRRRSRKN